MYLNDIMLDKLIMNALSEDVGTGDITTESTIPETARAHGLYKAKESGVLCGIGVAARVFELIDRDIEFTPLKRDGDRIEKGEIIAEVRGKATNVLTGERVGLNLSRECPESRREPPRRSHRSRAPGRRSATRERRRPDSGSSKSTP